MTQPLHDKIAIITGAGSGIGRACALRFAADGATVVVNDIAAANAEATVNMIRAAGGSASVATADVTSAQQVQGMIDTTLAHHGRVDILFNNAGGAFPKPTHETSPEEYRRIVALNLDSAFYGIHAVLPIMMRQRSGTILSTTSGAGLNAVLHLAAYGAAKAGLINLTKSIAVEYGSFGIRANVISPGPMDTPGMRAWLDTVPDGAQRFADQIPSGRLGTSEDIAHVAAFLASDAAFFVNGTVIPVDGGVHARLATPSME